MRLLLICTAQHELRSGGSLKSPRIYRVNYKTEQKDTIKCNNELRRTGPTIQTCKSAYIFHFASLRDFDDHRAEIFRLFTTF